MIAKLLVILGVLVNSVGTVYYIRGMFAGKVRPNKMTFLMWSIAPLIGGVAALVKGATWSTIPVFLDGFWPLVILLIALLNVRAYWRLQTSDYICGILSALALILWGITREPDIAIVFAILGDFFAAVPTLIKAWRYPKTENPWGYFGSSFSGLTGVIVATSWSFSQVAFPAYLFVMMGLTGAAALRTQPRNRF